jgi:hypothetical protein
MLPPATSGEAVAGSAPRPGDIDDRVGLGRARSRGVDGASTITPGSAWMPVSAETDTDHALATATTTIPRTMRRQTPRLTN